MNKINFDDNWKFSLNGGQAQSVCLPHDFSVIQDRTPSSRGGGYNGWYPGGNGMYTKEFIISKENINKTHLLMVEASYGITEVTINKNLVHINHNGYTEFFANLTPFLQEGKNKLKIAVLNDLMPNTRWYSGSGLYRNVNLLVGDEGYLHPWDTLITTKGNSVLVAATVTGKSDCVVVKIFDGDKLVASKNGESGKQISFSIDNAKKWSADSPTLYKTVVETWNNNKITDIVEQFFGIRDIELSHEKGFFLNGVPTKLKGGCVHHDNGILGACAYKEAEWRKVKLLKELGYNAVRTAHNQFSRHFMDACDCLGMLVIEDTFDCWNKRKTEYDYHLFFDKHWKKDLSSMIMRDRSRASVIMWTTGNEVGERDGNSFGNDISKEIADYIKQLDSRPLTNATCLVFELDGEFAGILANIMSKKVDIASIPQEALIEIQKASESHSKFEQLTEKFAENLDAIGYNYLEERYEKVKDLKLPVVGTEAHPMQMAKCWDKINKLPFIIGDFTWTAMDFLGESGAGRTWYGKNGGTKSPYPFHTADQGDLDICGFLMPQGACRKILWGSSAPSIWVLPPQLANQEECLNLWSWPYVEKNWSYAGQEGKAVRIDVYSSAKEVEVFINGKSIGKKQTENLMAQFDAIYQPGKIEVVNIKGGKADEKDEISTCGTLVNFSVTKLASISKNPDIDYYKIVAVDKNNMHVPYANDTLSIISDGFISCGNGDPLSEDNYSIPKLHLYKGEAIVAVKANAKITVSK